MPMSLKAELFHLTRCENALTFFCRLPVQLFAYIFLLLWQSHGCRRLGSTFALSCP
jgi:hypothetical protein